jgi:hypothetical protein
LEVFDQADIVLQLCQSAGEVIRFDALAAVDVDLEIVQDLVPRCRGDSKRACADYKWIFTQEILVLFSEASEDGMMRMYDVSSFDLLRRLEIREERSLIEIIVVYYRQDLGRLVTVVGDIVAPGYT